MAKKELKSILATDCGSTTTKAILIEYIDGEYRQTLRGEAPTTVEAPFEDVTKGVLNAIKEIEELAQVTNPNRKFLDDDTIITPQKGDVGADIYISTSSAGGGLQMMVAGVVKTMTGESAERAALGAGAIVMDVLASNDGRMDHEKVERIRQLRPDMILLSGGIDGGTVSHVVDMANLIASADPKARLGMQYKLPVIYAGNKDATPDIKKALEQRTALTVVPNLRPVLEREELGPARHAIHDLFMEHVMSHAPGYNKLMEWTAVPIMPTPGAVGSIIETIAKINKIQVVGVDIGGATTDVFSVFRNEEIGEDVFNRSVSANLGMSYSVSNVLAEAGLENVMRWVPFDIDRSDIRNRIKNKMIRPTTIPHALEELIIEQAIAREALRLAFEQHKALAVGLKGVQRQRTVGDFVDQTESGATLVNVLNLNMLVGSGGVLSHAPRRQQTALMMIDAFLPEGVTQLAVDSIFMMPHLGVLSQVHPEAATEVFEKDCMIRLGTCIAPVGNAKKEGAKCVTVEIDMPDGTKATHSVNYGDMLLVPLPVGVNVQATITPERGFDMGEGNGKPVEDRLYGGVTGIVIDARGRQPFTIPTDDTERVRKLREWHKALNIYPNS